MEVSHSSPASLPALLRVYSKYHAEPLRGFTLAPVSNSATFQISGEVHAGRCCTRGLTRPSGLDAAVFTTHVIDVNQPRPFVPNFVFSFQARSPPLLEFAPSLTLMQWVVAGAVLIAVALLLLLLHLYLRHWVVVNNVRANTGNLPICFASMPEYRGW